MLATLVLTAQATFLPVNEALEADTVSAAAFLPGASAALVAHSATPITTLVPLAPGGPSGSVVTSLGSSIAVTPDGTTGIQTGFGPGTQATVLDLPAMTVRATVAVADADWTTVEVVGGGSRALVLSFRNPSGALEVIATVVDLASASVVATYPLDSPAFPFRSALAASGDTLVWAQEATGGQRLVSVDVGSGSTLAEQPVAGNLLGLAASADGLACAAILSETIPAAMDASLLLFEPGSLASTGEWPVPVQGTQACSAAFANGDQAVFFGQDKPAAETYSVTVANGAVQPIGLSFTRQIEVNANSAVVWVADAFGTIGIVDAATGSILGIRPGELAFPLVPGPVGTLVLESRFERLALLDLPGAANAELANVPSSPDPQVDGPTRLELLDPGRAVLIASQSDDLRIVDLESGSVTGYLALDRGPVCTDLLDGRLLVGHSAQSLWIIDPAGPSQLAEVTLPGPAEEIHPEPGSTRAWVRVGGDQPGLVLVETSPAAAGVLGSIPLAGTGNPRPALDALIRLSSAEDSVAFDFVGQRAFACSLTTGGTFVEQLDLQALAVTASFVDGPVDVARPSLRFDPRFGRLFADLTGGLVRAFDVSGGQLSPLWQVQCATPFGAIFPFGSLEVAEDGMSLLLQLPVDSQTFVCPGLVRVDAASGALLQIVDGMTVSSSMRRLSESLVVSTLSGVQIYRDLGGELEQTKFIGGSSPQGGVRVDLSTGRIVYPAWNDGEGVYVALLQDGQVERICSPAEPNATGQAAELALVGSPLAGEVFQLEVSGLLPGSMMGYPILGSASALPIDVAGSPSPLCLGGTLGRFSAQLQAADAAGVQRFEVDSTALPLVSGSAAALTGETWTFQAWFSDTDPAGAPRTNFSDALSVLFL